MTDVSSAVSSVVDFGASQEFDATTDTALLFLCRQPQSKFTIGRCEGSESALSESESEELPHHALTNEAWGFENTEKCDLRRKLRVAGPRLLDFPAEMSRGSSSGDDDVFMVTTETDVEVGAMRVPLFATDCSRFSFAPKAEWKIIYPYERCKSGVELMSSSRFAACCPKAFAHLKNHAARLRERKQAGEWFGYSAARNLELHECAQIAVPLLARRGSCALIPDEWRGKLCPMASGGFTVTLSKQCPYRPEYILGLLNSRLLFWELEQVSNLFRGGWITCAKQYFGELPIRALDLENEAQKAQHDRMVQFVDMMLKSKAQMSTVKTESARIYLEDKCAGLDRQIDRLTYDFYGLTPEEVAIVEHGS
jgi:hypothetical protein